MRAHDFLNEDQFGTEPQRPSRPGTRPARGHGLEPRYKSAPVVLGGDNPDAPHKPNKGDEPVQRGDHVMVQDPNNIATVLTGTVKRIGRENVYVVLRNGETIAAPHDEVSKSYEVLSKRAHLILNKKGKHVGNYKVDEECAGVGIVTKQNSTADVGPGTIKKNLKAFKLSDDISVDEGILTTDVAHALKRYGEHVNNDVYKELAKMFSLGKITDALFMLKRLDPEVRKHATNIISGAGGLLGSKLTKESSEDNDYVQQLTSEFIRRTKLGRQSTTAETVLGLLDRFFKKFSIRDQYFDQVFNRVMRTTDHEAGILEMEAELEEWKASRQLCRSSTPDSELGASALASCKSQGLRARDGNKSHKLGKSPKSRMKMGGHRIKGKKYGGPLPDWS